MSNHPETMKKSHRWLLLIASATLWVLVLFPWLPNRSFEHYFLSGPLVFFLRDSPVWPDYIIGTPVSALWLFCIFYPIVRRNVFTVFLSVVGLIAWFGISILAAASASC